SSRPPWPPASRLWACCSDRRTRFRAKSLPDPPDHPISAEVGHQEQVVFGRLPFAKITIAPSSRARGPRRPPPRTVRGEPHAGRADGGRGPPGGHLPGGRRPAAGDAVALPLL